MRPGGFSNGGWQPRCIKNATSVTVNGYLPVIDDLYAGTLDDAAWERGLLSIADSVSASAIVLFSFNPTTGAILREENHRFDPQGVEAYRSYWTFHDCRRQAFLATPVGIPATEVTLAIPNWRRTPILNEFLLPSDAPHVMPVWLRKTDTKVVALTLQGTRRRGPFGAEDQERLRVIVPHVNRALEIRDRLEAANVRAGTMAACIDRTAFGVITLTAEGKILDANVAAEEMLRREASIRKTPDQKLHLMEPAGSRLARWLVNHATGAGPTDYLTRIDRGPCRLPISMLMNPVPRCPLRWVSSDPACILFFFDPERELRAQPALVAVELGISPREAELATLLAGGLELSEVAQRLCISIHTARTHLKAIYGKTGIGSQADLVRRIATGLAACGAASSPTSMR
jgi:DNA-binding CsgD family transcriptional regulator/PAS domain-containing protein